MSLDTESANAGRQNRYQPKVCMPFKGANTIRQATVCMHHEHACQGAPDPISGDVSPAQQETSSEEQCSGVSQQHSICNVHVW